MGYNTVLGSERRGPGGRERRYIYGPSKNGGLETSKNLISLENRFTIEVSPSRTWCSLRHFVGPPHVSVGWKKRLLKREERVTTSKPHCEIKSLSSIYFFFLILSPVNPNVRFVKVTLIELRICRSPKGIT